MPRIGERTEINGDVYHWTKHPKSKVVGWWPVTGFPPPVKLPKKKGFATVTADLFTAPEPDLEAEAILRAAGAVAVAEHTIMLGLSRRGRATVREVAAEMDEDPKELEPRVRAMLNKGLIYDTGDKRGRVRVLALTAKGVGELEK